MQEESPISTRMSGPQYPLSNQSVNRRYAKLDKGKTKMPEYEDDQSNGNESAHSLDSEYGGFEVPILKTQGAKKVLSRFSAWMRGNGAGPQGSWTRE